MQSGALYEQVACDLCGADAPTALVTKNGYDVVRCGACELVYVNPRLSSLGLHRLYTSPGYVQHQLDRAVDDGARPRVHERLRLLGRHVPGPGRLLDVGCSTGVFLRAARDAGWQVAGMDLSENAVAYNREQGLDVQVATLEQHAFPAAGFDVVTLFDSIEHMPSPSRSLRAVHALLRPGGLAMLTTPNIAGALPSLTYRLFARRFGYWDHPGPPGHIYQFSDATFARALESAGFTIEYMRTEAIDLAFSAGALEDALVDIVKARGRRPVRVATGPADLPAMAPAAGATARKPLAGRILRRALRGVARVLAWLIVLVVAAPAPLFGRGDSLVVLARRR